MNILIDTHVLLWLLFEPEKLLIKHKKMLQDSSNTIYISPISILEISIKYNLGKLTLTGIMPQDIPSTLITAGYTIDDDDITRVFATQHTLDTSTHKDPFDRLIMWHAIYKRYTLLTYDVTIKNLSIHGLNTL